MKNLDASAKRNSPLWYGWKIRFVWLVAAFIGMFAINAKAWCRNWATVRAYRLGRADFGVFLHTPCFSRIAELADAYDSGAYDFWLTTVHVDDWSRYLP
ncbi:MULTISPECIES: hypothetical protein [Burkholderia cepacia complex]|uniref:hypothetical protein n=1 Tax=Burkholderia cepacia complex TaxID=87882 RepID=UPI00158FF5B3|nr:hypothetical protein [Burkholderia cepacia]